MNAELSATGGTKLPSSIPTAAAKVLEMAMPLYRIAQWEEDDLFYTSGELTRRTLAKRGVSNYQPYILGMYDRGFAGFRQPLEKHWQAYLEGKVSREAAIRQILIDTTPAKN